MLRILGAIILFCAPLLAQFPLSTFPPPSGSGVCIVTGTQSTGFVLTATDNATACQWQAINTTVDANTLKNAWYFQAGGSANAITGSTTTAFPNAYAAGQVVVVNVTATNTGATTVNVSTRGVVNVTKNGTTALAAGNLVNGTNYIFIYDGTEFQVLNYTLTSADVTTGLGYTPLNPSNNLTDIGSTAAALANLGGAPLAATGYSPNQIITGLGVEYTSGLSYTVGAGKYTIAGVTYSSAITTVTMATADPSQDRFDAIIVDNTGTVSVITGTPATPPAQPTFDATTQLAVTYVYVAAAATTPSNVVTDNIYDENTEWTSVCSAHLNCASTNNPYHGTKDIEATAAVLNNNVTLTKPASGTIDLATRNTLVFYIRSKGTFPVGASGATAARFIAINWLNGSTAKGSTVILRDGAFGFSSANTTAYQQVSIPTSLFGVNGIPVTTLKFNVGGNSGSSSIGFYLDEITLQGGNTAPALPATLTNFRGTYSTAIAYNVNDIVISSTGKGYIALLANTNVALTNTTTWGSFALEIKPVKAVFDNGGLPITGTLTRCTPMDYSGTITAATLISDVSGSVTVDVRTVAYSSYTGPASASTITASATPALSSAVKYQDTTLTGWTTAVTANSIFCFVLSNPSTVTWVTLDLKIVN